MNAEPPITPSRMALRFGRILTGLIVLFVAIDGIGKVLKIAPVMEACIPLEIPERVIPGLGGALILATSLHAIPQTSILGAILLTGYLGGAVWTHVRMGGPVFPMIFPVILGAILWLAMYLREPTLRALIPLLSMRSSSNQGPD